MIIGALAGILFISALQFYRNMVSNSAKLEMEGKILQKVRLTAVLLHQWVKDADKIVKVKNSIDEDYVILGYIDDNTGKIGLYRQFTLYRNDKKALFTVKKANSLKELEKAKEKILLQTERKGKYLTSLVAEDNDLKSEIFVMASFYDLKKLYSGEQLQFKLNTYGLNKKLKLEDLRLVYFRFLIRDKRKLYKYDFAVVPRTLLFKGNS